MSETNKKRYTLYTIAHSTFSLETFAAALHRHQITAVADVRSFPYSKHVPHSAREVLGPFLRAQKIAYVFLGDALGARSQYASCYTDGRVDFQKVRQHENFLQGIARVEVGAEKFSLALMCGERDPLFCHRHLLITRHIVETSVAKNQSWQIEHILCNPSDGSTDIETHAALQERLISTLPAREKPRILPLLDDRGTIEALHQQTLRLAYQRAEERHAHRLEDAP